MERRPVAHAELCFGVLLSCICAVALPWSAQSGGSRSERVAPAFHSGTGLLEPFGLQGRSVTSLGVFGRLYAGTLDDGVFRREFDEPAPDWETLGLPGKRIRTVYPHASGALQYTSVGLEGDPSNPDSALVYRAEFDEPPWVVSDSGMTRTEIHAVWSLDGFPSPATSGETFAGTIGGAGGVWRRTFLGDVWAFVLDMGFGVCNVVRADSVSGNVWAGGETTILAPWLARSTDLGDTWNVVYPFLGGDNACNAIAVHPEDPDIAYAGMEGPVIKTTDGGETWEYTGLSESQAYIYGVALDSADPAHVLAGGTITNPNSWALWESFDQGATWAEIPSPVPSSSGISSILAHPSSPGTFFIGTYGHGVWRYRNPVSGVEDPPPASHFDFVVYPNPVGPSTILRFEVPAALADDRVRLSLYSADGRLVQTLIDARLGAGRHQATWPLAGAEPPIGPGVYHARLHIGTTTATCKLQVLR